MSTPKLVLAWIGALLTLALVLAAVAIPCYLTADHNRAKVQNLTTVCVQHGHGGFISTGDGGVCVG